VLVGVLMLLLGYLLDVFTSDRQRHFKLLLMSTAAVAFGVVRQHPPSCPLLDARSSLNPHASASSASTPNAWCLTCSSSCSATAAAAAAAARPSRGYGACGGHHAPTNTLASAQPSSPRDEEDQGLRWDRSCALVACSQTGTQVSPVDGGGSPEGCVCVCVRVRVCCCSEYGAGSGCVPVGARSAVCGAQRGYHRTAAHARVQRRAHRAIPAPAGARSAAGVCQPPCSSPNTRPHPATSIPAPPHEYPPGRASILHMHCVSVEESDSRRGFCASHMYGLTTTRMGNGAGGSGDVCRMDHLDLEQRIPMGRRNQAALPHAGVRDSVLGGVKLTCSTPSHSVAETMRCSH
jgi:hypothetical protein